MVSDVITFGGVRLEAGVLAFGLAESWNYSPSLGLGLFDMNPIEIEINTRPVPGLLDELLSQAYITSKIVSYYIDNSEDTNTTVTIGAVDRNKFFGKLAVFPFVEGGRRFDMSDFAIPAWGNFWEGNKTVLAEIFPAEL